MKSKYPSYQLWLNDKAECKRWLDRYVERRVLRKSTLPAKEHLDKAVHNMSFSNWLIEMHADQIPKVFGHDENFYDWAITSYYYSIYHQALALISVHGLSSKSHSATLCAVIYYFFHADRSLTENDIELLSNYLNEDDIDAFSKTKSLREEVCYGVSREFERDILFEAKSNAEKFMEKVRVILAQSG